MIHAPGKRRQSENRETYDRVFRDDDRTRQLLREPGQWSSARHPLLPSSIGLIYAQRNSQKSRPDKTIDPFKRNLCPGTPEARKGFYV